MSGVTMWPEEEVKEAPEEEEVEEVKEAPEEEEVKEAPEKEEVKEAPEKEEVKEAPEKEEVKEAPEKEEVKEAPEEEAHSSLQWSEEHWEEMWDRVEGVRHKLTRILNPAKITPYLRQCKVMDEHDEEEVLHSPQYPLRISKAGRLLDILRGQGRRGLQAFMESLDFYHPEQFTQLTGQQATQRCSLILDEEGPEGLTQFLLLEVRKLRERVRSGRLCERRLSQRCRTAEDEHGRAELRLQELGRDRLQMERLRLDWESASRELGKLTKRHLEQGRKYSRVLEEQRHASIREKELLRQVEKLKLRLTQTDNPPPDGVERPPRMCLLSHGGICSSPPGPPEIPPPQQEETAEKEPPTRSSPPTTGAIALMDILQQDRREATEQRQELCSFISRLQEELQDTKEIKEEVDWQCAQLKLKVSTLHLDWEAEQKRSVSYFNQILELEKERDQALRSRDGLQLELTDCLLDRNRLRKRMAELQLELEQLQRELRREPTEQSSSSCLHCSLLSLCSEEQCFGPCCSIDLDLSPRHDNLHQKTSVRGHAHGNSEDSWSNSEENLWSTTENDEKEINRLSTFPFPPCVNSIKRRLNIELDSGGSDDNAPGDWREASLWDSWTSLNTSVPSISVQSPSSNPSDSRGRSLADDVTIVGGNRTGIFVSHVTPGSAAEQCGLEEGRELLELEHVLFGGDSVPLSQCTSEVAHFSLQWWTQPSALKHRRNPEAYSRLLSQLSSPSFPGADSFYVRVNLHMEAQVDPPSMAVSCDDILHVTDTRHDRKYQWSCSVVHPSTAEPLQSGTMPNYNRAQQLFLVRLRQMSLEQNDFRKRMFSKKTPAHVRLVKAVTPSRREAPPTQQVFYTLSKRHEEQVIPYSLVHPVWVQRKRPVIFSPSFLSRRLIERLLQQNDSSSNFDTCLPEPIPPSERNDKKTFLLDSSSPQKTLGVRLHNIQDVISHDKHCLLELGLPCVDALLRHAVYPIVIHLRPKNKKHKKLRKLFPGCVEEALMEELCQVEELQLETLPLLHCTLEPNSWSCSNELLAALKNLIHRQQNAVAWVELDRLT